MAVSSDDVRRAAYVLSRSEDGRGRERDRDATRRTADDESAVVVTRADAAGVPFVEERRTLAQWRALVSREEAEHPRWAWRTSRTWYPRLLEAGIRVERCVDLALCGAILRGSATTQGSSLNGAPPPWPMETPESVEPDDALFRLDAEPADAIAATDELAELRSQADAIASVRDAAAASRLRLLLAAESAGSLVAAEMRHAGLPWRADVHDRLLTDALGRRSPQGRRPERMEALAREIRNHLGASTLNPDSPGDLMKALQRAGINATSTRARELREVDHPVMHALLEYKKLSRLFTANGWVWLESWVHDGRFRPEYVPGGVVTGRWATNGGGALQLPKQIRAAVVADPGWKLIVADAAQLEPRILAGLAHDERMADAGRGRDLYDGLVASGVVDSRQHAKVGMLAAMYGGTTGDGARVLPRLARAFPRALALVSDAAEAGERGDRVSTLLGRTSPAPSEAWFEQQRNASLPDADAEQERRARSRARDWGRFTRNFVVQGTAAEWALCWMADLRNRLATMHADPRGAAAPPFDRSPHLVYFLHDEVVVHAPESLAEQAAEAIRESAKSAGRLLFGGFPVEFPLSVAVVDSYDQAK
ncbi:bifunctional 3'-5' exonuclease/DNA polymerase [Planctomonas sp. JC2975]|uniref:bifunctional 3'-5' exonuclease/DNA polymerase n=1 Tax=Planctomonas sp. JC2975 TaxID=2729626 RepID=UPI001473B7BA|nr:bifunctional 3'-5' exonuclease/DNA polymerase [Planctomonas sp. JC2975]NNC10743.1 bifunctional 3'-5' exonuclease/DNA polymerase [Planctomonas sp. JC2975]